jgi:PEGA domain
MNRRIASITAAVFAAASVATPALAQNRHDRTPSSSGRAEAERARPAERAPQRVEPQRVEPQRVERQRVEPSRSESRDRNGDRSIGRAVDRGAIERGNIERGRADRPVIVAPRVVRPTIVRPQVVRPYYNRPYYSRPYYAAPYVRPYVFRPRFHLGFGIVVGYPVPYGYAYPYPVPVYGYYAPSAPVVVGPNSTQYGGVSLEITPPDASVYVDGGYAGLVRDFDGTRETLTLTVGRHHIEINAPGYEPMAFDLDTVPGQIVPYQGSLQPTRY